MAAMELHSCYILTVPCSKFAAVARDVHAASSHSSSSPETVGSCLCRPLLLHLIAHRRHDRCMSQAPSRRAQGSRLLLLCSATTPTTGHPLLPLLHGHSSPPVSISLCSSKPLVGKDARCQLLPSLEISTLKSDHRLSPSPVPSRSTSTAAMRSIRCPYPTARSFTLI